MNSLPSNYDQRAVNAVVSRTADRLGVEPLDLEPLATAIEPELVAAFAASDAVTDDSKLEFRYSGCVVRITGAGEVSVGE